MERLLQSIKIAINEKVFLKDPDSSELGKRIIEIIKLKDKWRHEN